MDSEAPGYEAVITGIAQLGRQQNDDEKKIGDVVFRPWHFQAGPVWRVVIASLKETTVSRKHLEVKPLPSGRFLLTNMSVAQPVGLPARELKPGESTEVSLPAVVQLGIKTVRLQLVEEEPLDNPLASLPMATLAPGKGSLASHMQAAIARADGPGMNADQLISWIQAFLDLLHSAAGSEDFYVKAARAMVDLVKLDSGRILIRTGDKWDERAVQHGMSLLGDANWRPSSRVLAGILHEKKTFWQIPDLNSGMSTRGIDAVVAAPILDHDGEVIGALYGERRLVSVSQIQRPISYLEAMLVEVLDSGVAAGLAASIWNAKLSRHACRWSNSSPRRWRPSWGTIPNCSKAAIRMSAFSSATSAPSAASAKSSARPGRWRGLPTSWGIYRNACSTTTASWSITSAMS